MGDFNLGRDISVDMIAGDGTVLRFPTRTGWDANPKYKEIDSTGLDGVNRHDDVWQGWSGTLDIDRNDSSVDDYFAQDEANFYAGINRAKGTITETISNPDGSVSQYRYLGVKFKLAKGANWKGDDKVTMQVGWTAEKRIKV